ncbi:hypothetical protein FCJ61_36365 [Burkholderia metallica]|uniref:hypothetical protein n=1 Tax=Burkholderia metallica TaxID=488729 RepID=UPI00157B8692|nr:hypothetical protein [Burkholderia metallica]NTZ88318.1 hypothetical protein [Burkholderia metallica]
MIIEEVKNIAIKTLLRIVRFSETVKLIFDLVLMVKRACQPIRALCQATSGWAASTLAPRVTSYSTLKFSLKSVENVKHCNVKWRTDYFGCCARFYLAGFSSRCSAPKKRRGR